MLGICYHHHFWRWHLHYVYTISHYTDPPTNTDPGKYCRGWKITFPLKNWLFSWYFRPIPFQDLNMGFTPQRTIVSVSKMRIKHGIFILFFSQAKFPPFFQHSSHGASPQLRTEAPMAPEPPTPDRPPRSCCHPAAPGCAARWCSRRPDMASPAASSAKQQRSENWRHFWKHRYFCQEQMLHDVYISLR